MSISLNCLKLVYPPFSNQEGEWYKNDPEVVALFEKSNLYMFGKRPEVLFIWDEAKIAEAMTGGNTPTDIPVSLVCRKHGKHTEGALALPVFLELHANKDSSKFLFEFGDKLFRVTDRETQKVLWWYTTDHLLYGKSHGDPRIIGFENYREFTSYELLYVGISTKQNSFKRVLEHAHHARISILSSETQTVPEARLTDEIIIFFFVTDSTFMRVLETPEDFGKFGSGVPFTDMQVVADAEKAFTNLLNTKYNEEKFNSFPKGKDGLYRSGLKRYVHLLDEDIEFRTSSACFRGAFGRGIPWGFPSDAIMVEGDVARLLKLSGEEENGGKTE